MDNARFVLIVFLVLLSMMLYQQWQIDYGPKPPATAEDSGLPAAKPPTAEAGSDVPAAAGGVPV
jgi:YidC/Oxa1 family membrane protein insertase